MTSNHSVGTTWKIYSQIFFVHFSKSKTILLICKAQWLLQYCNLSIKYYIVSHSMAKITSLFFVTDSLLSPSLPKAVWHTLYLKELINYFCLKLFFKLFSWFCSSLLYFHFRYHPFSTIHWKEQLSKTLFLNIFSFSALSQYFHSKPRLFLIKELRENIMGMFRNKWKLM